jgi:hypothetical protein
MNDKNNDTKIMISILNMLLDEGIISNEIFSKTIKKLKKK